MGVGEERTLYTSLMLEWVVGRVLSLKLGWSAGRCLRAVGAVLRRGTSREMQRRGSSEPSLHCSGQSKSLQRLILTYTQSYKVCDENSKVNDGQTVNVYTQG